jgi:hypothetical protein
VAGFENLARLILITLPDLILLLIGAGILVLVWIRPFGLTCRMGTISGVGPAYGSEVGTSGSQCCSGIPLQVRLESGATIRAETSPCSACLERLKPGDPVRITRIGNRYIARKAAPWRYGKC